MKTKNIFKTLAAAMLMPTMLLTTACSNDDEIVNTENPANAKGYTLPVTVNVTRQGDDATTRATYTYDEDTKKGTLSFSTGDKLFVAGDHTGAGSFAGVLDYDAVSGKFSGTVTTQNEYTGTAEELLSSATDPEALLIPAGYESYEYLKLDDEITPTAGYYCYPEKAFALTKAAAVEQFSFELAETYSSGFTLSPQNAIVSFTISGLTANKEVAVSFNPIEYVVISKSVTTSAEGVATFAIGLVAGTQLGTLTVDGNNIAMPTKTVEAGHIYNISRSATPAPAYTLLSAATTSDYGKVVCEAGHLHDAKTAVPAGCTAVGILGKVTTTGHGLILALKDATAQNWNTINGWESVTTYASTTLKLLPDDAARGANLTSYTTLGATAVSNWAMAQKSDYIDIFTNLGSTKSDEFGTTYDDNVNAYITTGVGGTELSSGYFSATEHTEGWNAAWAFTSDYWQSQMRTASNSVRPVLGF